MAYYELLVELLVLRIWLWNNLPNFNSHSLTELIIKESHHRYNHLSINATVIKLRLSGFWVPKTWQAVNYVISKCYICKIFNNLAFRYTKLTNLPKHRVEFVKPFQNISQCQQWTFCRSIFKIWMRQKPQHSFSSTHWRIKTKYWTISRRCGMKNST